MTRDDLHLDDDVTAASVNRFDKNVYDLGNIYLNINRQGYLNMDAGQTYELNVLRNWQAIESFMNSQIALPDALSGAEPGRRRQRRGDHHPRCQQLLPGHHDRQPPGHRHRPGDL